MCQAKHDCSPSESATTADANAVSETWVESAWAPSYGMSCETRRNTLGFSSGSECCCYLAGIGQTFTIAKLAAFLTVFATVVTVNYFSLIDD